MIASIRHQYNWQFTEEKYNAYIKEAESLFPGQLDFRLAETPIYVPAEFKQKILEACESIIDVLLTNEYKKWSQRAVPQGLTVPNEDDHPQCIAFDFGICESESGALEPQLIEMQGFPSLFAWQVLLPQVHSHHFFTPPGFSPYLNGLTSDSYISLLKNIIIGDSAKENVVLLEIFPEQQKTRVDFHATESLLDIKTVCLTKIIREGRQLFYEQGGKKIKIARMYNRVIFDDLFQQSASVQEKGKILLEDLDVTWVPHPNWFYKLSKFTLPFIDHRYVPKTHFLNEVQPLPADLHNYVVKPLFSFAGQGVIIDVTSEAIAAIKDPQNWIIQRKVNYANAVKTPGEAAKGEIRVFYFWESGAARPTAACNLARLSKGKMVGVRYNKDKNWVGGTFCLFEE